ncbi:molybdenum cofactor guanylyltransferase [Marinococcus halophilus]|uniref:Putative molybdenum cofactor guanylyltransferase n=1 Tax=Marinococcus halophilus TaxID=1371 RepID=A0A510Y2R4_MARHA|nr:molybdenum cofactor guanylyltransferase [Marinococcus halophilus]OZT81634.1 molybdenum cofactor guanylyltransferase [Marinococcus halophilus]GEK57584.1 putative molybdenum cofactor guanylyltransferase [Marinococcus halophilus]
MADGIILTGGMSERFGSPKAFAVWKESYFYERAVQALQSEVKTIWIISHPSFAGRIEAGEQVKVREDLPPHQEKGPLAGLFTGLSYTEEEWVFMLPVDMPLITKAEIRFLASYISPETEAVIPEAAGRIAPACGWFHADLLSKAEAQLESGDYRMKKVFSGKEKVIDVNQMYWRPEAFENINTAWQLEELNRKVK